MLGISQHSFKELIQEAVGLLETSCDFDGCLMCVVCHGWIFKSNL
jgi:hypothetical protein